jgi:hypothetical protein
MSSSNSPTSKDHASAETRALRRKQKAEAHLTSGCGFGKEKRRLIDVFWSSMWPGLEKLGWIKVRNRTYVASMTDYVKTMSRNRNGTVEFLCFCREVMIKDQ